MMRRKIIPLLVSSVMAGVMLATPALAAEWQPSPVQREVGPVSAQVTTSAGTTEALEITAAPRTGADGAVENVRTATEAYIKVTPLSETQAANTSLDEEQPTLAYADKAGETTSTGLPYSDNAKVNLVFETVTRSTSTTQFLEKVGGGLRDLVTNAVSAINDATPDAEVTVDDFTPAALFDVTASAGAIEQMGEDGSVQVELEVPGVTPDSDLIGVHFLGEIEDIDAVQQSLETDFEGTVLDYDAELVDALAGDGTVTITMTSFSPVLILTRVETTPEATEAPAAAVTEPTPEPSAEPETVQPAADNGGSGWVLPVVIIALVVVVIIVVVVVNRSKSKTTSTTGTKK